jgi:molybdate transport system substrate-binding protein
MTPTLRAASLAIVCLVALRVPGDAQTTQPVKIANAGPGDVRVLATAAIRTPLETIREAAGAKLGHKIVIEYGSARGNLKQRILAGEAFDVAVLVPDVNAELGRAGKVTAENVEIAKGEPAIGQRGDAPPADVSTPEALKQSLLNARWLWWSETGTSSPTVNKVFDTLGIRDAVTPKYDASGKAPLGPGEYQLHIRALSEILENKSLRSLGPVPAALKIPTVFSAAISTNARDAAAARAFVEFLRGHDMDAALPTSGMHR